MCLLVSKEVKFNIVDIVPGSKYLYFVDTFTVLKISVRKIEKTNFKHSHIITQLICFSYFKETIELNTPRGAV